VGRLIPCLDVPFCRITNSRDWRRAGLIAPPAGFAGRGGLSAGRCACGFVWNDRLCSLVRSTDGKRFWEADEFEVGGPRDVPGSAQHILAGTSAWGDTRQAIMSSIFSASHFSACLLGCILTVFLWGRRSPPGTPGELADASGPAPPCDAVVRRVDSRFIRCAGIGCLDLGARKNTLSTVFSTCGLLAYLHFADGTTSRMQPALPSFVVGSPMSERRSCLPRAPDQDGDRHPASDASHHPMVEAGSLKTGLRDVLPLVPWFILEGPPDSSPPGPRKLYGAEGTAFASPSWPITLASRALWFYIGEISRHTP